MTNHIFSYTYIVSPVWEAIWMLFNFNRHLSLFETTQTMDRLERILTMVYVVQNSQNFSGLFPLCGIPKNATFRKLDLFPSSGEGGEKTPTQLGP
jgi:hypothetical protein